MHRARSEERKQIQPSSSQRQQTTATNERTAAILFLVALADGRVHSGGRSPQSVWQNNDKTDFQNLCVRVVLW